MPSTPAAQKATKRKASNVAEYLEAHPTLKILGQQPDFIEPMDTPEKLRRYRKLVATSISKLPTLGYEEPTGDGETGTFSYVGDKPVVVDHDCET